MSQKKFWFLSYYLNGYLQSALTTSHKFAITQSFVLHERCPKCSSSISFDFHFLHSCTKSDTHVVLCPSPWWIWSITQKLLLTCDDCIRLNGCSEVLLISWHAGKGPGMLVRSHCNDIQYYRNELSPHTFWSDWYSVILNRYSFCDLLQLLWFIW
jgi:hypothetical protein